MKIKLNIILRNADKNKFIKNNKLFNYVGYPCNAFFVNYTELFIIL